MLLIAYIYVSSILTYIEILLFHHVYNNYTNVWNRLIVRETWRNYWTTVVAVNDLTNVSEIYWQVHNWFRRFYISALWLSVTCLSCRKNMKNVTSLLLMLVMLGVFIQSSQAVRCYECYECDEITSDTGYCSGDVCITDVTTWRAFRDICV